MTKLWILFWCLLLAACESLPKDYAPNYADLGYRSIEFVVKNGEFAPLTTQLGNATFTIHEEESLEHRYFDVVGVYKGVLTFYSQGCPWINYSVRYAGKARFELKDLMAKPTSCQIRITEMVDQVDGLEHDVHEIGVVDIFVIPTDKIQPWFSLLESSQFGTRVNYFKGNAAIQRPIGKYTNTDVVTVSFNSVGGILTINSTCPEIPKQRIEYDGALVDVSLKSLYNQGEVDSSKDCTFSFVSVPMLETDSYYGQLTVNTYKPELVKLEYPTVRLWKRVNTRMEVTASSYVAINCINNLCSNDADSNKVTYAKYKTDEVYWVRSITTNGRKSVFAYRNGSPIWW
jgi:hypothetical protein